MRGNIYIYIYMSHKRYSKNFELKIIELVNKQEKYSKGDENQKFWTVIKVLDTKLYKEEIYQRSEVLEIVKDHVFVQQI